MQLMHMLYCLYASSSSGVWRYSPVAGGAPSGMIHGFTRSSFRTKSPSSTTRSRTIGKKSSGSTRTGPGRQSDRNVAHLSFGVPFPFITHLPQTPHRQDHRYDSDPSNLSLT